MALAINIMVHAEKTKAGKPGKARWVLIHKHDRDILRAFLRKQGHESSLGDPVHSQHYFLSDDLLEKLKKDHQVVPFDFHQYPGQAVLIPVLTPHQVSVLIVFCQGCTTTYLKFYVRWPINLRRSRLPWTSSL